MVSLNTGKKFLHKQLPTLPGWCFGVLGIIWLTVVIGYGQLENFLVSTPHKRAVERELQREANKFQKQVDVQITKLIEQVDRVAAQPKTVTVLLSPREELSMWQKRARTLDTITPHSAWFYSAKLIVPDAERIYLLNPATDSFPIDNNFVAELLYESALNGKKPQPRAAKTDQWNIYIARPIVQDDKPVGALLVEFKPSVFQNAIQNRDVNKGRVGLVQSVAHFPSVNFYTKGNGWKEEYSISRDTVVKDWKLIFTGSKQLVESVKPSSTLFDLSLALLILIALMASLILVRKNISIPREGRRPSVDPLDDLFTEKYIRAASSLHESTTPANSPGAANGIEKKKIKQSIGNIPQHVFRDYDIRGRADTEITRDFAMALGRVLGTMVLESGEDQIALCADGRNSSPELKTALGSGILSTGCNIVDLGEAPTPVMNFALNTIEGCASGVMVTASHNPKDDNGFKIVLSNRVLSSDEIKALRNKMIAGKVAEGSGTSQLKDIHHAYINHIVEDTLPPVGTKIAIDCGNGITSGIAPELFHMLGCRVTELFTDIDGDFPNHDPDPTVPANLQPLINTVVDNNLDLGLAFDGDGDRLVAITGKGRIVWPDELLMVFARDIISRNPGADIIYDVKSTRRLQDLVTSYGGRPVMWKTGHAHMRNKVWESNALIGGEYSGHIFFNDHWYGFDDGLYAAARLLEVIALREQSLEEIVEGFPEAFGTEEFRVPIEESRKEPFMNEFVTRSDFGDAHKIAIDGLRVEYDHGWGLIRASNTSAALTLRFEADSQAALDEIIADFKGKLQRLDQSLQLPF